MLDKYPYGAADQDGSRLPRERSCRHGVSVFMVSDRKCSRSLTPLEAQWSDYYHGVFFWSITSFPAYTQQGTMRQLPFPVAAALVDDLVAGVGQPVQDAVSENGVLEESQPLVQGPVAGDLVLVSHPQAFQWWRIGQGAEGIPFAAAHPVLIPRPQPRP